MCDYFAVSLFVVACSRLQDISAVIPLPQIVGVLFSLGLFYSCNLCPYNLRGWHRPQCSSQIARIPQKNKRWPSTKAFKDHYGSFLF